jgi:hypothetical protein
MLKGSPVLFLTQFGQDHLSAIGTNGALADHALRYPVNLSSVSTGGDGYLAGVELHMSFLDTLGRQSS